MGDRERYTHLIATRWHRDPNLTLFWRFNTRVGLCQGTYFKNVRAAKGLGYQMSPHWIKEEMNGLWKRNPWLTVTRASLESRSRWFFHHIDGPPLPHIIQCHTHTWGPSPFWHQSWTLLEDANIASCAFQPTLQFQQFHYLYNRIKAFNTF